MSGQANPSTQTILSVIFLPVALRWWMCRYLDSTNGGNIIGLSGRSRKDKDYLNYLHKYQTCEIF